jgi:murein DD-endopeptidase MepM/ murein hydrolase activator NlpD
VFQSLKLFFSSPEPEMTQHRNSWRIWGYCLSGMSILSSPIAQAQATMPATIAVNPAPNIKTVAETPAAISTQAADLKPESALTVESISAEAPAAVPAEMPVSVAPTQPSAKPAPATVAPTTVPVDANPARNPDDEVPIVIITDRQPRPPVKNTVKQKATTPAAKPAAKSAAKPIAPNATPATTAETAIEMPVTVPPIAVAPIAAAPIATTESASPEPIAVRLGPISLSSAGISLSPSAVMPYFDPKLQMSRVPGLENLRLMFPVAIPAPITSLFGWRIHPISGAQRMHTGTDIGAPMGTPVLAALTGRVILADNMGGYGMAVALEHENGMRQTLYAHMSELFVRPGDVVQQGTVIGRVGSTGASTGAHLHFELRQMLPDGTWVAQDASQPLQIAMSTLVQSLQIAQRPQTIAQRLMPQRFTNPANARR